MDRILQSKEPLVTLAHWSVYEVPLLGPKAHQHQWIQTAPYEGISDPVLLATTKEKLEALCIAK